MNVDREISLAIIKYIEHMDETKFMKCISMLTKNFAIYKKTINNGIALFTLYSGEWFACIVTMYV